MIYVLGERPGPNTDPSDALYPHTSTGAAARLVRLLGFTQEEYLSRTIRLNAIETGNGSTASAGARLRVEYFLGEAGSNPFIVCGKAALKAMPKKYRNMQFGDVIDNVLLIPHPSGLSRAWNDKTFAALIEGKIRAHTQRR